MIRSLNIPAKLLIAGLTTLFAWLGWQYVPAPLPAQWSERELALIESLWLDTLPPMPPDTGNAVADDPVAARLGHQLFFDKRLSASGTIACATCHRPELHFTDQLPVGVGLAAGDRNTMGLVGVAYSPWYFWDGRKDSLWSQALEPLENPLEHGSERMTLAKLVTTDSQYANLYQQIFGELPDLSDKQRFPDRASPLGPPQIQQNWQSMNPEDQFTVSQVFANIGKSLAAYQRLLNPASSRFDDYVTEIHNDGRVKNSEHLTRDEIAGLRLFLNKAQCVDCHNGPLFTNNSFHNTAVLSSPGVLPALGRVAGLRMALDDPFNCLGEFSDADPAGCQELRFARGGDEMLGAQRTASLRNLQLSAPYMHAGQLATLRNVIRHYNAADIAVIGHNEAKPLRLRAVERRQLEQFLGTLGSPIAVDPAWLTPP
jgi:cytochrome c peroxidase